MIAVQLEVWASLAVIVAGLASVYFGLKHEFGKEFDRIDRRFESLEDQVFKLATGLKPVIEQAQREQTS